VVSKIIDSILCSAFNMHKLMPFDEFFLYDEAPNKLGNVSGLLRFSKFEFKDFQKYIYDEFCMKVPKAKTVLT
jgi:hypothetical protein